MPINKSKKLALLGIIIGIVLASIANDEVMLIQAQSQAEKDMANFYIGIASVVSALTALLTSIDIIQTRSIWIIFVRSLAATVTLINVIFLSIIPQILRWIQP